MTKNIRKAVIPAAGFGTRMLPATKSVAKEMLTVVDRPIIDYIVEEALASGIEHVVIVTGRGKGIIEDHFDLSFELDNSLRAKKKDALADKLTSTMPKAGALSFVRQQEARGLGHAVWAARHVIGDEPFAVLLPDMLMIDKKPCLAAMRDVYEKSGGNILAVEQCRPEDAHKFGIVSLSEGEDTRITGMVEKPPQGTAPSNLFISGRYILQPEIFDLLEKQKPGAGNEIQLTDALIKLMETQEIRPYEFSGRTFDCGAPAGFVNANLHMAMMRPDVREDIQICEYGGKA